MTTDTQKFLTTKEAAKLLRIGRKTLYVLINEGQLPAVKVGERKYLIPYSAIDELERVAFERMRALAGI